MLMQGLWWLYWEMGWGWNRFIRSISRVWGRLPCRLHQDWILSWLDQGTGWNQLTARKKIEDDINYCSVFYVLKSWLERIERIRNSWIDFEVFFKMYQCWAECWYHLVCDDHCSVKYERVTYCQQPPAHADLSPILQTSGVETKIHNYKTSQQQNIEHTWHNHQMRNDKFTEKHWLQIYVLSLSSFSYPSSKSMNVNAKLQFQCNTRVSS